MKAYAVVANGSEEAEFITVVDLLKRAGIETVLVSVEKDKKIIGSHHIKIEADMTIDETNMAEADILFVPGGMPGSERISACTKFVEILKRHNEEGKLITAICAAPAVVLARHGITDGKIATCYPGFEEELTNADYSAMDVCQSENVITARGLGCALEFALTIIERVYDSEYALSISRSIILDK